MALTEALRESLKRKAAKGTLEVEHLLRVATEGDAQDAPFLRALKKDHDWPDHNREGATLIVPLGRWTDTVCTYLEKGHNGLILFAEKSPEAIAFCLGLLEETKVPESAATLLAIGKAVLRNPKTDLDLATQFAGSFNRLLCFKGAPVLAPDVEQKIRGFLHALLSADLSEGQRATAVCALRAVGNDESLAIVTALPAFTGPWTGVGPEAVKQIKKRLRQK